MKAQIGIHPDGKLFLPVCSACLNPFEDDEDFIAIDTGDNLNRPIMESELYHMQCFRIAAGNFVKPGKTTKKSWLKKLLTS
jgi:hypothetical protein